MTRRHFFGVNSTGVGLGGAGRTAGDAMREAAAHGGLSGFPHFPPKAKRVIYLFQSGGPSQMELFDYKPRLARVRRGPICRNRSARASGSPACRRRSPVSRWCRRSSSSRSTAIAARGSANCCRTRRRSPTDLTFHQEREHRSDQSRSGGDHVADRRPTGRPAEHGRVGVVRDRARDRGSACVRA